MKINLGCGNNYRDGWANCDISHDVKADKYFDVRKGLPFEPNSAELILAECILEQIGEEFVFVMNELHRVLDLGGTLFVEVPLAPYANAFQDPMDIRHFTKESFTYLNRNHRRYEQYGKHYGFKPWHILQEEFNIKEDWGRMKLTMQPEK